MKKIVLIPILALFIQNVLFAQNYTVVYEKEHKPDVGNQLDKITDPVLKKQLEAKLIKVNLYELLHKEEVSTFSMRQENENKTDETLELQGAQTKANVNVVKMGMGAGSEILYKDLPNRIYLKSTSLLSKDFLVKDTLPQYNWELSKETKTVGNYVCQKATAIHNNKVITAWYASSIPIGDGPDEYYGLPGLIIELIDDNSTYNVLSVQETPDISITKPSKGKEITKSNYQKLKQDRMEALKQQFKN